MNQLANRQHEGVTSYKYETYARRFKCGIWNCVEVERQLIRVVVDFRRHTDPLAAGCHHGVLPPYPRTLPELGKHGAELMDLHVPALGPADRQSPADRFLLNLAAIQAATDAHGPVISRIDLTPTQAQVRVSNVAGVNVHEHWFGPFALNAPRDDLIEGLVRPAGLCLPRDWDPMPPIPYGTDRGWREHWASVLLDIASYYWALREAPYGFRYERIELELSGDSSSPGHEAVVFTSHPQQGARRWVTRIPIPVPAHIASDVTGLGFTIREWIAGGGGRLGDDGSFVRQL